jgi:DNA-binding NarL/FixJ family response regulator
MYKVCLVEDDPDSRELLVDCLRSCHRLQLMGAYGTAEEALREVPRINPDVVLMDIRLPGRSGIDCLIALRQLIPPCNATVVMLTEYEDGNLIFEALKAGAEGYLLKRHASARELLAAIVEVMAGGRPFNRTVAQKVTAFFQALPPSASGYSVQPVLEPAALTPCEQEVLKFAARGLTYKEVAGGLNISVDTVGKHLQSIFHKLHIHCRTDPRLYSAANSLEQSRPRDLG